ncbi:CDP-alcohol phosphatidyltransferase family protein [Bradyrhizobium sp. CB3481]|uniref:CDP-alcohol phosphatidyltransferase family protein n=1 Tax=Bradyrhizobium sp. CB3481 TaxID=3039158 RepID=UPI0024B1CE1F|nr:CDP-alcohol phosphatidyltransferase family protein [Bradyrhizobium sp. CB3481]WFU14860.1 CDP-alcohol phosphatidyltransferase family protein [Bradyrhizobium sp. CB3481]
MIWYLRDYANAITALAYLFAVIGLFLALNGKIELGVAAMLWTWFLDHWDGHVARKTSHLRRPGATEFGKCFDGFADFVHGVVFPAAVVILVGHGSVLSLVAGLLLVLAGAIRLSHFESVGLTADVRFTGIPVSYDTPLIAILILVRPFVPCTAFPDMVAIAFIVLAVLHVNTAIKVPPIRGRAIPVATGFAVIASIALALLIEPALSRQGLQLNCHQ